MLWALILGSYAVVVAAVALDELSAWSLLIAGSLPAAALTVRVLKETEARALNLLVRNSARLHMQLGVLLALGLAIEALT
jgi:1,4-dihydroxy-2-naphthoate octaprenyltransferase